MVVRPSHALILVALAVCGACASKRSKQPKSEYEYVKAELEPRVRELQALHARLGQIARTPAKVARIRNLSEWCASAVEKAAMVDIDRAPIKDPALNAGFDGIKQAVELYKKKCLVMCIDQCAELWVSVRRHVGTIANVAKSHGVAMPTVEGK